MNTLLTIMIFLNFSCSTPVAVQSGSIETNAGKKAAQQSTVNNELKSVVGKTAAGTAAEQTTGGN